MGLISIGGLGSGLDVSSIVEALVNAERAPKQNSLDRLEAGVSVALTGLGGLSASLDDLRTAAFDLSLTSNFSKRLVSSSDNSFFTATAATGATPGNYDIEVEKLAIGSQHQTQIFTGGSSTTFGNGTLTFTVGAQTFDVAVSSTDTLQKIRDNINAATGNSFVSVNLLNNVSNGVDTGSILTIDSSTTGSGNDLVISFSGDAALTDLAPAVPKVSAGDASIIIDGFTATSATNKFANIIQDVTIEVKKAHTSGSTASLDVSLDKNNTKALITTFVDAFNAFVDVSKQLGSADSNQPGLLLGDYTLRQVSSQLRNLISSSVASATGSFKSLASIGIATTKDGYLEINSTTLDTAISADFEDFDNLFAGDNGFASQLRDLIGNYTGVNGIITGREDSLNAQLSRIASDRLSLDLRIDQLQFRLTKQFATMDAIVAQMNSTQSYITQQFENLPGFSSGKK